MKMRNPKYDEIPLLAEMRYEFSNSILAIKNKQDYIAQSESYLRKHFSDGNFLAILGEENGTIICCAMLCIYDTLPRPSLLQGKTGLLLNVYTAPEFRHRGYAQAVLKELFSQAKVLGVRKIHLDYTSDGFPLYCKLGFKKLDHEMEFDL